MPGSRMGICTIWVKPGWKSATCWEWNFRKLDRNCKKKNTLTLWPVTQRRDAKKKCYTFLSPHSTKIMTVLFVGTGGVTWEFYKKKETVSH